MSLTTFNKLKKRIYKILGEDDADFLFNKFGNGENFIKSIYLLPFRLKESTKNNFKKVDVYKLGEENIKAWIAYTIYDYVRDLKIDNDKLTKLISLANILNRESFTYFIDNSDNVLKKDIIKLYDILDLFYTESYVEYNDIVKNIYKKSIPAAIVSLFIIKDRKNIISFFKNYFTARQLSDDLDDYEIDLERGIITPVTCLLLEGVPYEDVHKIVRKDIDKYYGLGLKSLRRIEGFDSEGFINVYVREC